MKKFFVLFLLLCSLTVNARSLYLVELKIWKDEAFSLFNLKNERNAIELELPIDKDLFYSLKTFKIKVINKRVQKIDSLEEKKNSKLFMLKLKSQKYETFSFNFKNARNAIVFELPVDEAFYNSVKKGQKLKSQDVYTEAFDIIPEFFSEIAITVEGKRIAKKK